MHENHEICMSRLTMLRIFFWTTGSWVTTVSFSLTSQEKALHVEGETQQCPERSS